MEEDKEEEEKQEEEEEEVCSWTPASTQELQWVLDWMEI